MFLGITEAPKRLRLYQTNSRLTRRVSLVVQELLSLPEHLRSLRVFGGVRVTRSLVLYVCFVDRCLSFCTFFLPLCCLSFDIRIPIAPLVSSNSSYFYTHSQFSNMRFVVQFHILLGWRGCYFNECPMKIKLRVSLTN